MPKLINLPAQPVDGVPLDQAIKSWLGDTWDDVVPAAKAQGSITFHYVPNDGDKLTVNGVEFVFGDGEDIEIEDSVGAQAVATAAALNDSADAKVAAATYTVETNPLNGQPTGTVFVKHDTGGVAGNQFTLKAYSTVKNRTFNGPKNAKIGSRAIEVTPRLTGGEDASTVYGEVVQNFVNE